MAHDTSQGDSLVPSSTPLDDLVRAHLRGTLSRRTFLRRAEALGLTAVAASVALSAAAPVRARAAGTPKRGGTLKVAYVADPQGMDPALATIGASHLVIEQVYSTLTSLDPNANPQPDLATSWKVSADGTQYTFYLRKGVTFHNGDELTAEDVKFTFDRLRNPKTGYSYLTQVETISSVDVIDAHTVKFTLTQPTGPFLVFMAFPGSSIVPKREVQKRGNLSGNPIGSGAFRFVSYQPGTMVKLARNEQYYEPGKPYVDALEMHIIADDTARNSALLGGIVDFSSEVAGKDWATVTSTPGFAGVRTLGGHWHWIMIQDTNPKFRDPRVRQAIGYAVDRKALIQGTFFGQAEPILGGVIPSWSWAYAPDLKMFTERPDVAKAKQLLAAAGFPHGFEASMILGSAWPVLANQGPILQQNLAAAGIRVKLSTMENPRYLDIVWNGHKYELSNMFWLSPLADPDDFMFLNYTTKSPMNPQEYSSALMDTVLRQARATADRGKRKALYWKAQKLSLEQMPLVPTVNAYILMAHSTKIQNFVPMRTGFLRTLKDVWFS